MTWSWVMNEGGLTNRIYETVVWLSLCVVIILHLDLMCITLVARQMILVTCRDPYGTVRFAIQLYM